MFEELLEDRLPRVRDAIAAAQERAGRTGAVRVIAVTKGHPVAAAVAAVRAGVVDLGENRVQELEAKRAQLGSSAPAPVWHLIGHLQTNKARRALELAELIHSIDSVRLAEALSKEAVRGGVTARVLVQVNVSGEETKGGFDPDRAVSEIGRIAELPGVACEGLMTMAPYVDDERVLRDTFAGARRLLERCRAERLALAGWELSMGMSHDYGLAVEEGSTMVRLGTVLFGERV
jgi:PLP dependent protein